MILVLDFGFGQRRSARDRPIHGLLASVDEALFHERGKGSENFSLIGSIHGTILTFPVRQYPKPVKLLPLGFDVGGGEILTRPPQFKGIEFFFFLSHCLGDLVLNRQSMTIPTRHVGSPKATGRFVAQDRILENLVQGSPDVDIPVGKGRAVVKDEGRAIIVLLLHALIQPNLRPMLDSHRLPFHRIGPHGEISPGKIKRILELFCLVGGRHRNKRGEG